jgi:hypothetical protein
VTLTTSHPALVYHDKIGLDISSTAHLKYYKFSDNNLNGKHDKSQIGIKSAEIIRIFDRKSFNILFYDSVREGVLRCWRDDSSKDGQPCSS